MHKGRNYRQVLPHNLTPDMIGLSAPVRCFPFMQFEYASNGLDGVGDFSETLKVDLPTLSIEWKGRLTIGSFDFGWRLQQRLFDHLPGIRYRVEMVDNFGSLLQADFEWFEGDPAWTQDIAGSFSMGEMTNLTTSGFFTGDFGCEFFVVHYHEEP